jgi:hypothetical protein
MKLKDIGREGLDWLYLAQTRDSWGGPWEHGNDPSGSIKFGEILD